MPLSPMTANFSVSFGLFGTVRSCAATPTASVGGEGENSEPDAVSVRMDHPRSYGIAFNM